MDPGSNSGATPLGRDNSSCRHRPLPMRVMRMITHTGTTMAAPSTR